MVAMPLAHVSWAIADNADRKACDAFFIDLFGAQTAHEMLETPEVAHLRFDREERLMMVGDTMLIPIAPGGRGLEPDSPTGEMLRRNAGFNRWLGVALRVPDVEAAARWMAARGFSLHFDPGMEKIYFLVGRGQVMGMRLELLCQDLPGDPRNDPAWTPAWWRDEHPLGIEGLQAIGLSAPSLDEARALFAERLDWPELGQRHLAADDADCLAFHMGDTVLEAMVPRDADSPLARHLAGTKGIYCLTFKVRDAPAAAAYLRGKGLDLVGDLADRFAIRPDQAHGRLIRFTQNPVPGYPPPGSRLHHPGTFDA